MDVNDTKFSPLKRAYIVVQSQFHRLKTFLALYTHEVSIFPGGCYRRCLKEAKLHASGDHGAVWERLEFCKMGCDITLSSLTLANCYDGCYLTCIKNQGHQMCGLKKDAAETIDKYKQQDSHIQKVCLIMCQKGCGTRISTSQS